MVTHDVVALPKMKKIKIKKIKNKKAKKKKHKKGSEVSMNCINSLQNTKKNIEYLVNDSNLHCSSFFHNAYSASF